MKNKLTVSIGIPAHNEEANIQRIIRAIQEQEEKNFIIKEILVISDASTDTTVEKVKQLQDPRIRIIADDNRMGKSYRLNQIFSLCQGDILFLLDADIYIKSTSLLSDIITHVDFRSAGIMAVNAVPLPTKSFFAKCLNQCKKAEEDLRKQWHKGNNYLAFHGAFLGLYGNFARTIKISSNIVNNDAYLYFLAKKKGYEPRYLANIKILYKTPTSFKDHLLQASRFISSKKELSKFFTLRESDYALPFFPFILYSLKYFLLNPVYSLGYVAIFIATKIMKTTSVKSSWTIAVSTKRAEVINEN